MAAQVLDKYFLTVFLIIGFSLKLWSKRGTADKSVRYYWMTVIATTALIAADALEGWTQTDVSLIPLRILFSVIGYAMRPAAALSIALIIYPGRRKPHWLWIPAALNALVYCTAFFTGDIAFGYTQDNHFTRGVLSYAVLWVSLFYIVLCVGMTWKYYRDRDNRRERFVMYACALACIGAGLLDMETEGSNLNSAIMISAVFLYVFLRSIDMDRDPLTKLLNRMSFFDDCNRLGATISAVGSVDMNGLRALNDKAGPDAGDEALREIGRILGSFCNRNVLAYRTGGDEFALLFLQENEENVKQVMASAGDLLCAKGYAVSTGYALRDGAYASVQDLIRWADEKMHESKAKFYSQNGHDRRRRS